MAGLVEHLCVRSQAAKHELIPTTKEFGTALGDIVRCPTCGHMQLDRFPTDAELAAAYGEAASEDYLQEEAGQRESFRRVLERIERHTSKDSLLDVGCWVGFLLSEAERRGWREVIGVEPSEWAGNRARTSFGLRVISGDLTDADLHEDHFSAVVMGDVLEHLPDAGAALDRARSLLRPEGVLALEVPDAGSRLARAMGRRWWSVIPTHVHYFTRGSLEVLLRRRGFEPIVVTTDPKAFTVRYYLDKTSGYSPGVSAALVRAAERLGIAERVWAPDFRDRMLVVARRLK